MLMSHNELVEIVERGVITNVKPEAINAASIDIHLGTEIIIESYEGGTIDYRSRQPFKNMVGNLDPDLGFILKPGQFILAQSAEVFNLPDNISAEYKLKSSMARIGLEHLNAGWCDAGWNGSVLTLEFKNMLQYHSIRIRPGDSIGQMVFFKHRRVPDKASYATKGRYNGDKTVSTIKE